MKNLYYTNTGFVALDAETNEFHKMETQREAISRILIADDDMHIVLDREDKHYETDAKKGDIVIMFYDQDFPKPIIAINSEDWMNNLNTYNEIMAERRNKFTKSDEPCCDVCEAKCAC